MELLKLHRRRSRISDAAYIALNVGLAIAILFLVWSVESIWLALAVMLLSKWRVVAVRPRYWAQNLLANMVDIVIGIGHVIFLYASTGNVPVQIALTLGWIIWLLFVKPRSKHLYIVSQSFAALFVGTTALSMIAYDLNSLFFVASMAGLGYVTARHILLHYETPMMEFFSLVWALVCAELAWFGYSWLFAYTLPISAGLKLSQLALIVTLIGFVAERAVASHHRHGEIRRADMAMPIAFAVLLIMVMVLFFSKLTASSGI